jgi:hypothetical protein
MPDKLPKGWVKTTLGEIKLPSRARALPSEAPDLPYVGMEHVEAQTMKLLGQGQASGLKSSSVRFSKGDVLYGKMRPYLASWGMYRGSSFLLQHAYTVHLGVVELLSSPRMSILWQQEFGAGPNDSQLLPIILSAADLVRGTYQSFATANESRDASDTLVTKVLLGTLGCIPACDRYFIDGFKAAGFRYSYLNAKFVTRLSQIAARNLLGLRTAQSGIASATGVRYPLMKLLDMYFWQLGYERGNSEPHA